MSGPFGSSQWMYSSGGFYPDEIEQSLRFNDDDSAYLSRTPASAGNRKTWTWSGWVKLGEISNNNQIIFGSLTTSNYTVLGFSSSGQGTATFGIESVSGTSTVIGRHYTQMLFRDPSAWYHIVAVLDATNTSFKVYVNGAEQTLTAPIAISNTDHFINNTSSHALGAGYSAAYVFDGYLAEVNFIDGQALDPTSFGEFKSGVWVANEYTGSYGTNGFYLNFSDSANIGDDLSGNANDWTANNLVATDVVLDSPTNNFAVLNAVSKGSNITLSQGNLQAAFSATWRTVASTIGVSSGKWYAEFLYQGSGMFAGILEENGNLNDHIGVDGYGFLTGGDKYTGGTAFSYDNTAWVSGDVVGVLFDADSGEVSFSLNGSNKGVAFSGLSGTFFIGCSVVSGGSTVANFGQDSSFAGNKTPQGNTDDNGVGDFYYAPPAGYLALCAANLPDPVIDPAQDDVPSDYFNTVTWTGDGTSSRAITGVGFQPDFSWTKIRTQTYDHNLLDSVRGSTNRLISNLTTQELSLTNGILSFDADGFTVGDYVSVNGSGENIVAWNWLAGNGTSSNTDGSITSTVSVNQKAGFSIVGWTGNSTSGSTIGHGLDATPEIIIAKSRTVGQNWLVYSPEIGNTKVLLLNGTSASFADGAWNNTTPTSSVFTVNNGQGVNESPYTYIAYCFHSVEGYSKFGSYTGNGSTDGPFIHCGFLPSWIMVKRTDAVENWHLLDEKRDPFNFMDNELYANLSNAEGVIGSDRIDFVSNGIKVRTSNGGYNASGGTYIYMAFAENPFKYANAR